MAEFCLDCMNKILGTNDKPKEYILSWDLDLCEECGEWKRVVIRKKYRYVFKEEFIDWIRYLRSLKGKK